MLGYYFLVYYSIMDYIILRQLKSTISEFNPIWPVDMFVNRLRKEQVASSLIILNLGLAHRKKGGRYHWGRALFEGPLFLNVEVT